MRLLTEFRHFAIVRVEVPNLTYQSTRDKRIAEHRCVTCGARELVTKRLCQRCLNNVTAADKARDERLKLNGLCRICGKATVDTRPDGTPLSGCRPCLDVASAKDAARRAEQKLAGIQKVKPPRKAKLKQITVPAEPRAYPDWVKPDAETLERNDQIARLRADGFTLEECAAPYRISKQRVLQILEQKKDRAA